MLFGRRGLRRDDGFRRTFASFVVRVFLLVFFRVNCVDANVPYRLMRTAAVAPWLDRVPADFSLANIALAVLLKKHTRLRRRVAPLPRTLRRRARGGFFQVRRQGHGTLPAAARDAAGRPVGHQCWMVVKKAPSCPNER